jgi:acetoin utilization protein AcuB
MMKVRNWMKHPVHSVKLKDTAQHARALLEEHRINQLPVVIDGKLAGIITDRDLRDAFPSVFDSASAAGKRSHSGPDPAQIYVGSVMTENVFVAAPGDHICDAARVMRKERIGALPVIDNGRLVGILTRSDLLDALVSLATDAEPLR